MTDDLMTGFNWDFCFATPSILLYFVSIKVTLEEARLGDFPIKGNTFFLCKVKLST